MDNSGSASSIFLGFVVLYFLAMALFGTHVATEKGRSPLEGITFGVLLGPFGLIIVACLPTIVPRPRVDEEPSSDEIPILPPKPEPLPEIVPEYVHRPRPLLGEVPAKPRRRPE